VVGGIGDVKELAADVPTTNQVYFPFSQAKGNAGSFATPDMLVGNGGSIVLRSEQLPEQMIGGLRSVVRSIDPQLPLTQVESMESIVEEGQAPRRFNAALISGFAAAAVLLDLLGIYSVSPTPPYNARKRWRSAWRYSVAPSVELPPHSQPDCGVRCYLKSIRLIHS
jgi:hypothetical protein